MHVRGSFDMIIENNTLLDCSALNVPGWAIIVEDSTDIQIKYNYIANLTVTYQPTIGVQLFGSSNVTVQGNCLLNNSIQANDTSGLENYWNLSYPIGGNYWSDYLGVDDFHGPNQDIPGSDGIGDSAYIIDGNSSDGYPLMNWPFTLITDTLNPETTIELYGTLGQSGWFLSNVTVNLSAIDDQIGFGYDILHGSGVNCTKYHIGPIADWLNYSSPFEISVEGIIDVQYYSVDNSNNIESTKSKTVMIDKTRPVLYINQTTGFNSVVNYSVISWLGTDMTSGINYFEVCIDGGAFVSVGMATSYNFSELSDGMHNVTVKAIDVAGNEVDKTIRFTVDTSVPNGGDPIGDLALYVAFIAIIVVIIMAVLIIMIRKKLPPTKIG